MASGGQDDGGSLPSDFRRDRLLNTSSLDLRISALDSFLDCIGNDQEAKEKILKSRLLAAVSEQDTTMVKHLLQDKHVHPDSSVNLTEDSNYAICRAAAHGNINILTLLLEAGANPNIPNLLDVMWQRRPVHICASKGHLSALKLLISYGADINQLDNDQRTPLHWVAMYGQTHMIKWMLENGAVVNAAQQDGFTPLHTATCLGHLDACEELLNGGASLVSCDRDGWTPLHTAVCYGYTNIVRLLLRRGANVHSITTKNHDSVLHIACSKSNLDMVKLLLEEGVAIEGQNDCGFTPLHAAVFFNRLNVATHLVKVGADVNTINASGASPFYLAAVRGDENMLWLLLMAGCCVCQATSLPATLNNHELTNRIEFLKANPQTLKELCLVSIRKSLAPKLQVDAFSLPLPTILKRTLALEYIETQTDQESDHFYV